MSKTTGANSYLDCGRGTTGAGNAGIYYDKIGTDGITRIGYYNPAPDIIDLLVYRYGYSGYPLQKLMGKQLIKEGVMEEVWEAQPVLDVLWKNCAGYKNPETTETPWDLDTRREKEKQPIKEKNMRGLYEVNVVDYQKEKFVWTEKVIADNIEMAKVLVATGNNYGKKELREYDFIIVWLGDVRIPKEI